MTNRWLRQDLPAIAAAALCLLVASTGAAEARGIKWRPVPMSSTPKVVVPPPAPTVVRSTPTPPPAPLKPAGEVATRAAPASSAAPAMAQAPAAPSLAAASSAPFQAAAAAPRASFMSGLTGGLVGYVVGKSVARSVDSPEAWAGLVLQLLLFGGLAFLLFKLVMNFTGGQPAMVGVPAGKSAVTPDRMARVIDRQR